MLLREPRRRDSPAADLGTQRHGQTGACKGASRGTGTHGAGLRPPIHSDVQCWSESTEYISSPGAGAEARSPGRAVSPGAAPRTLRNHKPWCHLHRAGAGQATRNTQLIPRPQRHPEPTGNTLPHGQLYTMSPLLPCRICHQRSPQECSLQPVSGYSVGGSIDGSPSSCCKPG